MTLGRRKYFHIFSVQSMSRPLFYLFIGQKKIKILGTGFPPGLKPGRSKIRQSPMVIKHRAEYTITFPMYTVISRITKFPPFLNTSMTQYTPHSLLPKHRAIVSSILSHSNLGLFCARCAHVMPQK